MKPETWIFERLRMPTPRDFYESIARVSERERFDGWPFEIAKQLFDDAFFMVKIEIARQDSGESRLYTVLPWCWPRTEIGAEAKSRVQKTLATLREHLHELDAGVEMAPPRLFVPGRDEEPTRHGVVYFDLERACDPRARAKDAWADWTSEDVTEEIQAWRT